MVTRKVKRATEGKVKIPEEAGPLITKDTSGIGGEHLIENSPTYYKSANENVIKGANNAEIVLGTDTNGAGGYGKLGHTAAGAIDLVAGRGSCVLNTISEKNEAQWIRNDFRNDGARVYISQKTSLDEYFDLPYDKSTPPQKGVSGVAIKADDVRLISRDSMRFVVSQDSILSNTLPNNRKVGVEFISGIPYDPEENYNERLSLIEGRDDIQAIPKGDNLKKALEDIAVMLDTLSGILINYIKIQNKFNNEVAAHAHIETFYGNQGFPSKDLISPLVENNINTLEECTQDTFEYKSNYLGSFKNTYLNENSKYFINSRYHKLN